jgi:hypothetical protein
MTGKERTLRALRSIHHQKGARCMDTTASEMIL